VISRAKEDPVLEEKRSFWEQAWARIFGDGSRRPARIERVVEYVVHRLGQGARLEEAIQDEYVRRQTSPHEVGQVVSDPRIVEAARGRMHQKFGSKKLSTTRRSRRDPG
jgi:hypothetical protein